VKAVAVAPLFQSTVLGWAHSSGALMQCAANAKAVVDVSDVDWSHVIKSSDDAVLKVSEQYKGAPEYLVDLVRHRLVFDCVDAQLRCLTSICQDPNVVVVRVHNSQAVVDRDHQAPCHGNGAFEKGAVTVSFILTTAAAYTMGVAGHVMELELVLQQIWMLFDQRAHDSYVEYRRALLIEQSVLVRALRQFVVAVRSRRSRARVVAFPSVCLLDSPDPADDKEAGPGGHAQPALVAIGSCVSRVRSCRQTSPAASGCAATSMPVIEGGVQIKVGGGDMTGVPAHRDMTGVSAHSDIQRCWQVNVDDVKECSPIGTHVCTHVYIYVYVTRLMQMCNMTHVYMCET